MTDIATTAAHWVVRLSEEDLPPSQRELAEYALWLDADPRHREAVEALSSMVDALDDMPGEAAASALKAGEAVLSGWQAAAKHLVLFLAVLVPLFVLSTSNSLDLWMADKRTPANAWQSWVLEDNSTLVLSGNSAVNVNFDQDLRTLELLKGDLLIDVGHDVDRPLEVVTEHGRFRALGTRFVVQQRAEQTVLTVLESSVQAHTLVSGQAAASQEITAGEQISVSNQGIGSPAKIDPERFERNWRAGKLVVNGTRLTDVLDELARHHSGYLLYDDTLAPIEVMAVLPLDDPQQALELLGESLPIDLNRYSPWLVHVTVSDNL
ncbi:MAG: FecR domain-containing protein [Pseudomonadota bacterium]